METGSVDLLIFLPGFLGRPGHYTELVRPLWRAGLSVLIPNLGKHWLAEMSGRFTAADETALAIDVVDQRIAQGRRIWLAGHSRGGQVAWGVAEARALSGLMLVDPVDSAGRKIRPVVTAHPAKFDLPTLIIGAGLGGRCAPAQVNHDAFAAQTRSTHLVLPECGHADLLNTSPRRAGRRICPGGPQPNAARVTIGALLGLFIAGRLDRSTTANLPAEVDWR